MNVFKLTKIKSSKNRVPVVYQTSKTPSLWWNRVHNRKIGNYTIHVATSVRNLGVLMDRNLSLRLHIARMTVACFRELRLAQARLTGACLRVLRQPRHQSEIGYRLWRNCQFFFSSSAHRVELLQETIHKNNCFEGLRNCTMLFEADAIIIHSTHRFIIVNRNPEPVLNNLFQHNDFQYRHNFTSVVIAIIYDVSFFIEIKKFIHFQSICVVITVYLGSVIF